MINLKLTIGGAIFGLIISLFFGIVGGIQFGVILLRALLSSVLCGGIMALASFLFRKFLSDPSGDLASVDSPVVSTGNNVDITIDESVLPDSDDAPDFFLNRKFTGKTAESEKSDNIIKSPKEKEVPVLDTMPEKAEPVSTNKDSGQKAGSDVFIPTPLVKEENTSPVEAESELEESLDSLPDLDNIIPDSKPAESEVIEDSAFAMGENKPSVEFVPDAAVGADTTLMAETIRTLLKREG